MIERMACLLVVLSVVCLQPVAQPSTVEQVVDHVTTKEAENVKAFEEYAPLVETYIQTFRSDKDLGRVPASDQYFLGRVTFKGHIREESFLPGQQGKAPGKFLRQIAAFSFSNRVEWVPLGFAQMTVVDANGFDREHYDIEFLRREFLGEVRCLVFDVVPRPHSGRGRFLGRIWVEDRDYNIVRFNGTFVKPREHMAYLHFDSWRVNVADRWLPAYIYVEESAIDGKGMPLRAETRLWGYEASVRRKKEQVQNEFTAVRVDAKDTVNDQSGAGVLSPTAGERAWEREAEANVLERLEVTGVLAPPSEVDKVLQTVVNNLMVTNDLVVEPDVHCRVLLTAPIETFTVGHTIVISRGLLDVLSDEASLAAVLAHELAHIALAHDIDTKFAFDDGILLSDQNAFSRFAMTRSAEEESEADVKSIELLKKSPYKEKLGSMVLFMKEILAVHDSLPNLTRGQIGNSLVEGQATRLTAVLSEAPQLDHKDVHQVAALPLGGRIGIDPWSNRVTMRKATAVPIVSPHEKMPFQITHLSPYLTRTDADSGKSRKDGHGREERP